jgi:putative heme-binding domain-containing protein
MKQLVADVQSKGDPARGEQIFRRADTACFRCHSIAGAGGTLAPDLTSAGSAPVDYLVDSILQPNKAIKEGYHSIIIDTTDGDQLTGIKVRQTDKDLILRDAVQDEIVIPLKSIQGRPREGQSMMPAGLADPLTRQELTDLVRFLSELGRPGPYAVSNTPTARRWEIHEGDASAQRDLVNQATRATWAPAYAQVAGTLPITPRTLLARAQVNVTTPGPVTFVLTPPVDQVLVDDHVVKPTGSNLTIPLTPGAHTITIAPRNTDALKLQLADTPNSPAKAQFITGR